MELKQRYAKYASVHAMLCTAPPQIVSRLPATTEEIAAIQGIGKVKSDKIGPRLLDVPSPSNKYRDRFCKNIKMTGFYHTILKFPELDPDIYLTE